MCLDPVSVIGFAVSAASSVASFAAKQQEADAQNQRYNQNYVNSLAAARDEHNTLTLRAMQEQEATAQKDHQLLIEGAEREADVQVSAAGGNVGGLSVDALVGDVIRQTATQRYNATRNAEMTAQQLTMQQKGVVTKAESRINSVAQANGPSPLGLGLEIAGAGLKAYKG